MVPKLDELSALQNMVLHLYNGCQLYSPFDKLIIKILINFFILFLHPRDDQLPLEPAVVPEDP